MKLDLAGVLDYVRGATLPGVREVYDGGGKLEPVATLFYEDRARVDPYRDGPIDHWVAHLRMVAARLGAVGAAVVVASDEGVLVLLEHRELSRDVYWWAKFLAPSLLGEWEQKSGNAGGHGAWSIIRAGGARGALA